MFFLKKLIGPLLFPHSIFLGMLAAGVLLLWFSKKQKLARMLVTLAAAGFFVLSYPMIWGSILVRMEKAYPPLDLRRPDVQAVGWVVVLGGGGSMSPSLPATGKLSSPSLARLVEGIRITRALPEAKLLVSGGPGLHKYSDALTMQDAARILGVDPQQIVVEGKARDTEEEAIEVKRFVGSDRFIMVTSAVHMPRAMSLFEKQGMTPIPAPTDFYVKGGDTAAIPDVVLPTSSGGPRVDALVREFLGLAWARLRGRI